MRGRRVNQAYFVRATEVEFPVATSSRPVTDGAKLETFVAALYNASERTSYELEGKQEGSTSDKAHPVTAGP